MHEINGPGFRLEIEIGEENPSDIENADGWLTFDTGGRWSATFLTIAEVGRVMDRWRASGECLSGSFFTCPDLVILRNPGVQAMFEAVSELVRTGEFSLALKEISN